MNAFHDRNSCYWCETHVTVDVIAMETCRFKVKHVCAGIISALSSAVTRTMPSLNINQSTCAVIIQHYVNACSLLQCLSFEPQCCSRKLTRSTRVKGVKCLSWAVGNQWLEPTASQQPCYELCAAPLSARGSALVSTCAAITQLMRHPAVIMGSSPLAMQTKHSGHGPVAKFGGYSQVKTFYD